MAMVEVKVPLNCCFLYTIVIVKGSFFTISDPSLSCKIALIYFLKDKKLFQNSYIKIISLVDQLSILYSFFPLC